MRWLVLIAIALAGPASAHADERDPLVDRFTAIPAFGLVWLQIDGQGGAGMLIQPTVTRTFDRVELQGELAIGDWAASDASAAGALIGRLGGTARYQVGRVRVEGTMTLDLVAEAGLGVQRIAHDDGRMLTRPDLLGGVGFRMLSNVRNVNAPSRIFMGMEVMFRAIVAPGGDLGFMFAFGVPFGR